MRIKFYVCYNSSTVEIFRSNFPWFLEIIITNKIPKIIVTEFNNLKMELV